MKKTIIFSFIIFTIVTLCGCSAPDPVNDITDYLEELDEKDQFSGVVLIAKDGDPIFKGAYGLANRNYDLPNQLDTKFNLGSMNKMITAVAILQLAEQGKISVDDKIIEHLPGYPNQDVAGKVTIHQLLTHTSGIGDFFTQEYHETPKHLLRDLHDYLPLFAEKPLQFNPGTRGFYSSAGYIVLGMIIEETSGQNYYDYVMENIYQPCGMEDTDSFELDKVVPDLAVGYEGNIPDKDGLSNNLYWLPVKGNSAGGGYSTAGDLLKFSNCLMNNQLLSPEWTNELLGGKVDSPIPSIDGEYAYGFIVSVINDHSFVGHGGTFPGVCTNLDIFVDMGYTAVVLSNISNDCIDVIREIRNTLLN
jgi:CubicO group peptidase (beta-lactamase class C family)